MCSEWEWTPPTVHTCAWGQAVGPNKTGWLSDPKGFCVTSLHIWDRKREKWKVLHLSRKEVFSSNSNVGIEIKINGVPDATKHILLMKWTFSILCRTNVLRKVMINICAWGIIDAVIGRKLLNCFFYEWETEAKR